jgi:amidase
MKRAGLVALALAIGTSMPALAQDIVISELPSAVAAFQAKSIDELQALMATGQLSSAQITELYIERIKMLDSSGPMLRSVIAVSPNAIEQARASDARRRAGKLKGALDGIPVLIKDNIETRELPTTAGSLALRHNMTRRDAPLVARLRAEGAVILGKTNLSEWANIRSTSSMSGWSAVGGLVRNPYALDRSSCGSSSGSGAAVAASLAAVAVGTETDGSVVCPASMNGLVGLKPTLGLVSRTHVVPISHSQDTPGPMGRSVKDAAILFSGMIGRDPADAATAGAERHRRDYAAGLSAEALRGKRVGYWRPDMSAELGAAFDTALEKLRGAGATLVEVKMPKLEGLGDAEFEVLKVELKADLDAYLATTPASVTTRTLDQVIAFNEANRDAEMPYFGQEIFLDAARTRGLGDPAYKAAREKSLRLARQGLDTMLREAGAELLVTVTYGTPWLSDPAHGDQFTGPSASELPAVSGYPHLTVPMGLVEELPAGLSFIGAPWSDGMLLSAGYAYEQASRARVKPEYRATIPAELGPRSLR